MKKPSKEIMGKTAGMVFKITLLATLLLIGISGLMVTVELREINQAFSLNYDVNLLKHTAKIADSLENVSKQSEAIQTILLYNGNASENLRDIHNDLKSINIEIESYNRRNSK